MEDFKRCPGCGGKFAEADWDTHEASCETPHPSVVEEEVTTEEEE